jgi:hypothetical protein
MPKNIMIVTPSVSEGLSAKQVKDAPNELVAVSSVIESVSSESSKKMVDSPDHSGTVQPFSVAEKTPSSWSLFEFDGKFSGVNSATGRVFEGSRELFSELMRG